MPDVGDLLFIGIMHILIFGRPDLMFQDASLGWHLVTGQWIFDHHTIPKVDLFSYTFPDKAWVAYEWMFDLFAYILTRLGGLNLLAVFIATTIALLFTRVYDRARRDGGPLGATVPIAIIGIFASAIHWLARPHVITLVCIYIFLMKLEDFQRGTISSTKLYLWLSLPMLVWVNCHPAFGLGMVLIGIYFVSNIVLLVRSKSDTESIRRRLKQIFIAGILVALVTLVNPYGIELYRYIIDYLHGSSVLAETDEFKSPIFHGDNIHVICLEILMALYLVGLAITRKRLSLPYFATMMLFTHMSLSAVRNIPLFSIAVIPALGLLFSSTRMTESTRSFGEIFPAIDKPWRRISTAFNQFAEQEMLCKMRIIPIAYVMFVAVAAFCGGSLGGSKVLSSGFSPSTMPTATLTYIQEHKLPFDRGFNNDNWGGLIRYKLGMRVFIDDRADFYGEEFYTKYGSIVRTKPGWRNLLDNMKIDWILMPKDAVLSAALKNEEDWQIACEDPGSYLFTRKTGTP
ncbi:MAG: hypothetical protein K2X93_12610 [Candidatus Obscuribacterales bacterium]|nr:hypothetical protein [Candidatus Obscuribacterales bacterium]